MVSFSLSTVPPARLPMTLLRRHVEVIGAGPPVSSLPREPPRHRLRARPRSRRHVDLHRRDRIRPARVGRDPLRGPLEPLRVAAHQSPLRVHGIRRLPFRRRSRRRRFPRHQEVLRYLEDFARDFEIYDVVRLRTKVVRVEMGEGGKWAVRSRRVNGGEVTEGEDKEEVYDAVVVCNGHYTEPRVAEIPGIDTCLENKCTAITTVFLSHSMIKL